MTQKTAKDAMTPISDIFSLHIESKLDEYAPLFDRLCMMVFTIHIYIYIYIYNNFV
jgi:CBS domain containing-hemolysin-like protein